MEKKLEKLAKEIIKFNKTIKKENQDRIKRILKMYNKTMNKCPHCEKLKEYHRDWQKKNRNKLNAKKREKYQNDPEYRQQVLEQARTYYPIAYKKKKEKYQTDPEFRARCLKAQKEYNLRKKEDKINQRMEELEDKKVKYYEQ